MGMEVKEGKREVDSGEDPLQLWPFRLFYNNSNYSGFTYWGLFFKRVEGMIKEITCKRLGKYLLGLLIFPFLYPIVQILL